MYICNVQLKQTIMKTSELISIIEKQDEKESYTVDGLLRIYCENELTESGRITDHEVIESYPYDYPENIGRYYELEDGYIATVDNSEADYASFFKDSESAQKWLTELIYDLRNLLLRFNITSRVRNKKVKYKTKDKKREIREYLQLSISGQKNLIKFKENISFSLSHKKNKLISILGKKHSTNVDLFPNCSNYIKNLNVQRFVE